MAHKQPKSYAVLSDILLLVGYAISPDELKKWKKRERDLVEKWASRSYLRASDNLVHVPKKPAILNNYKQGGA